MPGPAHQFRQSTAWLVAGPFRFGCVDAPEESVAQLEGCAVGDRPEVCLGHAAMALRAEQTEVGGVAVWPVDVVDLSPELSAEHAQASVSVYDGLLHLRGQLAGGFVVPA